MKKIPGIIICACILMTLSAGLSNAQDWPAHLRILTGPGGGQWYAMGEPIAEALSKVLPASSRAGGGVSNITNITNKTGDLAFSLVGLLGAAASGLEQYQDIKWENTQLLANIYPQVFYFLVRKDFAEQHGIRDMGDMLGLSAPVRFASLSPGTASEFILDLVLEYGYGAGYEQLKAQGWQITFSDYAQIADGLVAGDFDCFAYTAGTNVPLIHTMEQYTDVVILPMSEQVLEDLAGRFKTGTYIIEAGDYKAAAQNIPTLGDYTCLVVRGDFPTDLVYALTRALWDNKDKIAALVTDFGALAPATAQAPGVQMHPGAVQFWTEVASPAN